MSRLRRNASAVLAGCMVLMLISCARSVDAPLVDSDRAARVVSLDYCADQFVLQFVPREHILALSPDARKYFSYHKDRFPEVPSVRSEAENVLALRPTRVVRSYGGGASAAAFYERVGIDVVQLGYPATLQEVREHVQEVAAALGNAAEGARIVGEFDRRLQRLRARDGALSALYTTPGGVTTGPGSLVHEMLLAAGLTNYEQRAGWRQLPLEQLVYEPPDTLARATFGDPMRHVDPWTRARHPRARALVEQTPGVEFEGAWTSCGAWFLMDAVEVMHRLLSEAEDS